MAGGKGLDRAGGGGNALSANQHARQMEQLAKRERRLAKVDEQYDLPLSKSIRDVFYADHKAAIDKLDDQLREALASQSITRAQVDALAKIMDSLPHEVALDIRESISGRLIEDGHKLTPQFASAEVREAFFRQLCAVALYPRDLGDPAALPNAEVMKNFAEDGGHDGQQGQAPIIDFLRDNGAAMKRERAAIQRDYGLPILGAKQDIGMLSASEKAALDAFDALLVDALRDHRLDPDDVGKLTQQLEKLPEDVQEEVKRALHRRPILVLPGAQPAFESAFGSGGPPVLSRPPDVPASWLNDLADSGAEPAFFMNGQPFSLIDGVPHVLVDGVPHTWEAIAPLGEGAIQGWDLVPAERSNDS